MKLSGLAKLGRRKRLQPQVEWVTQKKSELEGIVSDSDLLEVPFPEWCQTLKIKTPQGLQPFELFPWQEKTAALVSGKNAANGRQIVVLSSRQTGKTSLFLAIAGYCAQTISHFTGVVIHKTGTDSALLARRLKRFLGDVKLTPDNLSLIGFSNGAFLHFRSSNPGRGEEGAEQCGRGLESVDFCLVDESQIASNLQSVLGVIGPAMTWGNPKLSVMIGTAGSKQSHYYELLSQAAGGADKLEKLLEGIRQGTEKPFQILNREGPGPIGVVSNWRCIPEFAAEPDFLGRIKSELNLSDSQVDSEYELIFGSSVDAAVFDFPLIMAAKSDTIEPYSGPSDVVYFGIDPSGAGRDYAVCIGLRESREDGKTIYEVVHLYRKRTGVSEQHLNAISQQIQDLQPIAATVEKNSMGQIWLENLSGLGLPCAIDGFSTTAASKPVLIGRLQIALERGVLKIPTGPIIDELLAYRRTEKGKLEAGGNAHDDTVMALALALHSAEFNK